MLRKRGVKKPALCLSALLLAIAFSVTGCGSSEDTTTASQEETTQEETVQEEVTEEPQEEVAQEETKVEVVSENLLKYTSYNSGYATYLAEIKNTGTTSVYIHNVSVDVEDMNGSLLKSEEFISAHPNVIAPGESAYICSNVITSLDEVNLDNVGKAILHYDADETSTAEKLNVELSEVSIKANSYGGYAIMGRATNTGTEDLEYFYIGGDIRDGNGVLQNYVYTSIDSLKAGETKGFEASILWGPDVDYSGSAVNLTVYD